MTGFSVHDQPDFERTYTEDDLLEIRRGDLRALLDLATGSMDFASGFWDNEQTEIARNTATVLGIDPNTVTPRNMLCTYNPHEWEWADLNRWAIDYPDAGYWRCRRCHLHDEDRPPPPTLIERLRGTGFFLPDSTT